MAEPAKHLTPEEVIAAKAAKRLEILKQRREKEAAKREGFYTGFDTLSAVRQATPATAPCVAERGAAFRGSGSGVFLTWPSFARHRRR